MQAILFDLGRVLVHYDHQTTVTAIANDCQVDVATIAAFIQEVSIALGVGDLSAEGFHQRLVKEMGFSEDFATFIELYAAGLQRDSEALAYAVALQQRPDLTVGIISNTNEAHVYWLDEHLPELIQLDLVMMSNEVAILKPDVAIFKLAMELLTMLPEQCIFVDDLVENIEAAQALGLAGITHTDWTLTRPQLERWLH